MKEYRFGDKLTAGNWYYGEFDDYLWVVHDYDCYDGPYGGQGEAIAYDGENLYIYNLQHCSCDSPFSSYNASKISVKDYLSSDNVLDSDVENSRIRNKVLKLLS